MDEEAAVLARLDRLDALELRMATPAELLQELRLLLREAETLAASREEEVVARRRTAPHGT